ncbi:MAG TPA: Gfo/Idh/MocA family oxidoreductase [Tepidisphaeraceae bacterium]|nr:Gfo/Idh/MocA family oxidoreductase [Tepidisphaeraceae bacterium]
MTDVPAPYRVVIIGIGAIAELIAQVLAEMPRARLVGGSCRTEAKGRKFAERFGVAWYADNERLLDEARPDVAIICTPSGQHRDAAIACAARKIHVLCEKPLEITTARVRDMIDACDAAGVRLGGLFPQRFNPINQLVRETAAAGRLGSLSVVAASVPWWRDDAYYGPGRWHGKAALDGGGALMNQAIHTLDLMQWFAAATMPELPPDVNAVEEVFAYAAKRGHDPGLIEVEDTAGVSLRFRNGAIGSVLAATSMYPGRRRHYEIAGRDGTIAVREDELVEFAFRHERPDDQETRQRFARPTQHAGGAANPLAIDPRPHQRNIADFLSALDERRQPLLTGRESLKAVEIIEACYESARTGAAVRVDGKN